MARVPNWLAQAANKVFAGPAMGSATPAFLDPTGGGSGTVTTVSVVTANGVSGSVANPTTTPAITLTLGDITPSKVNGNIITAGTGTLTLSTFTLTVAGTASITGTNTGDQTSVSGNAGTATALATARAINGVNFDGTAPITVTADASTLTSTTLNATVVTSSLTAVGTIGTGVWHGTAIGIAYIAAGVTADADGSTVTFDWTATEIHTVTLTASRTIAFSNDANGKSITIIFKSDGSGAWTPVWPSGMKWKGGVAPTLTNTNAHWDLVSVLREASGSYLGTYSLDYS